MFVFFTRLLALPLALALLASCQMVDQQQTNTREERLIRSQTILDDCERTRCTRLNLDSQLVADYGAVSRMTYITEFMASFTDFDDMAAISPLSDLQKLHIGYTRVSDLSGLSNFPQLTLLHAQNLNAVTDFSAIGQLGNLRELAIGGNDLGDAAFLKGLRITALNLDRATLTDLDALRGHPTLQTLDINDTTLPQDISVLETIPNLRSLSVSDWDLTDAQRATLDRLAAQGVAIDFAPVVIVC